MGSRLDWSRGYTDISACWVQYCILRMAFTLLGEYKYACTIDIRRTFGPANIENGCNVSFLWNEIRCTVLKTMFRNEMKMGKIKHVSI